MAICSVHSLTFFFVFTTFAQRLVVPFAVAWSPCRVTASGCHCPVPSRVAHPVVISRSPLPDQPCCLLPSHLPVTLQSSFFSRSPSRHFPVAHPVIIAQRPL